jgi:hypothetical protein
MLGDTGTAIWAAFQADRLDAGSKALVRELARCADTLDQLDGLAMGRREEWASLVFDDMGEVHLMVDKILEVRRNHQLALKALFAEVRAAGIKASSSSGISKDEEPEDMLAKLRRQKERRENQSG